MSVGAVTVLVLLLLANAFFVAVEFALVGSNRAKLEPLAAGRRAGRYALEATGDLTLQLAGAQLGITMASLGLGYVGEPAVAHLFESALGVVSLPDALTHTIAFVLGLSVVVFLHMVVGEMVPKNLALADPERAMLRLAVPNHLYVRAFRPFLWLLNTLANAGMRPFGVEPSDELEVARTPDQFVELLAESREEGFIAEVAHDLLAGALRFADTVVDNVMVPRDRIVAVARRSTAAELERIVVTTGHSRLPVIGRDLDDVLGFVHAKDLLATDFVPERPLPLTAIRRMVVVQAGWRLDAVLRVMRRARVHFAVVVEASGRTAGIVTLEDLLEELVGDIADETDR